MIVVYAHCHVLPENQAEFEVLARRFVTESRRHQGCVHYDCARHTEQQNTYAFVEKWASLDDLNAHLSSDFFQANGATLVGFTADGLKIETLTVLA
ncbi:putative quinol monooxygenase [Neisseriaceae bacterium B1]